MIRHLDNGLTVETNSISGGKYKAYLYDENDTTDISANVGTYIAATETEAVDGLLAKIYGGSIPKFLDGPAPAMVTVADFLRTLDLDFLAKDPTHRRNVIQPVLILGNITYEIELAIGRKQTAFTSEDYASPDYRDKYTQACKFLGLQCEFVSTSADDGYHKVSW